MLAPDRARVRRLGIRCARIARGAAGRVLVGAVRGYQLSLSPWLGARCRYVPTCSAYAIEAIERYGPWVGSRLAAQRIARCHPWGRFGYDPVPEPDERPAREHRDHEEARL